jgi:hypothetical protein
MYPHRIHSYRAIPPWTLNKNTPVLRSRCIFVPEGKFAAFAVLPQYISLRTETHTHIKYSPVMHNDKLRNVLTYNFKSIGQTV